MELRRGRVPYLRVSSLSDTSAGELAALADTPDVLREAPAFVLDLRGNSGGVDRFARAWFGRMSAGGLRYGRVQRLESDVVIQGELNSNVCNGSEEGLDATSREYLEERARVHRERLRELEAHFGGSAERWHLSRPRWGGHAATTYDGWIVVLLNKGCASACENFVTFLEQMPHVLFLGENTAGTGVPGDAETYRLPHSRIWVWAATKLFFNPPGVPGFPEGRGYLPDVWLDTASADGIAARVAECLSDERCGRRLLGEIRR
jgi:C-terminal processing protease CtpA/Prc